LAEASALLDRQQAVSENAVAKVRIVAALLLGAFAALAGAAAYGIVLRRYTNFEFSIITVLTGFMVGQAVRIGAGNCTGLAYQAMAVFLTYVAIAGAYVAVRAAFLYYDMPPFSLTELRALNLLVQPVLQGSHNWQLGVTYALALTVAWCACGRRTKLLPG
jgi:hypothetical protein